MNAMAAYEELADRYHALGRHQERDRFLVLAMDAAMARGRIDLAEGFRARLLQLNPAHLIKPYTSCRQAAESANFSHYLAQLRKSFPPEKAVELVRSPSIGSGDALRDPNRSAPRDSGSVLFPSREVSMQPPPLPHPHSDPLSNEPFRLAPLADVPRPTPAAPAPARPSPPGQERSSRDSHSASGEAIGKLLFLLVLAAGVVTLAYVVVWPAMR